MRLQLIALLLLASCSSPEQNLLPPEVDYCVFESTVYPILVRDCGFSECHGNDGRAFQLWSPGRARLDPATPFRSPATEAELQQSFSRTLSMLTVDPEQSLLLRKPLEPSARGAAHQGIDRWGRDIYADRQTPAWQTLHQWALTPGNPAPRLCP